MFKWLLRVAALLVALALGLFAYGGCVPEHHVSVVSARYATAPAAIWAALNDVPHFKDWRIELEHVEALPDIDGRPHWREQGDFGTLELHVTESEPPRHLATQLIFAAHEEPDYSGSWIFDLAPDGAGTRVTLKEDGHIHNRFFRSLAHVLVGYQSTQEQYLRALGRKFGEEVEPERGAVGLGD
jgi:uncharacterized protein YndB with AHSA1/START domain